VANNAFWTRRQTQLRPHGAGDDSGFQPEQHRHCHINLTPNNAPVIANQAFSVPAAKRQ